MATSYELFTVRKAALIEELHLVVDDLIKRHNELGMKASGDWIRSLEVRETRWGAQIWGEDYTKYLEDGRKPGKMPPSNVIVQWLQDKFGYSEAYAKKIAFPIQKKIAKEGTDWYKKRPTGLINDVINDARVELILNRIKLISIEFFKTEVRSHLKQLAV